MQFALCASDTHSSLSLLARKYLPLSVPLWTLQTTKKCKPCPQSKPKPVPLSVAAMPICDSCPAGVTVAWPEGLAEVKSSLCVTMDVVPRCLAYLQCEESRNTGFRSPHSSSGTTAACPAAFPGPKQLPAQPGGCRAQVSSRAAFLKCLLPQ